jgi:hypothetical protein
MRRRFATCHASIGAYQLNSVSVVESVPVSGWLRLAEIKGKFSYSRE